MWTPAKGNLFPLAVLQISLEEIPPRSPAGTWPRAAAGGKDSTSPGCTAALGARLGHQARSHLLAQQQIWLISTPKPC